MDTLNGPGAAPTTRRAARAAAAGGTASRTAEPGALGSTGAIETITHGRRSARPEARRRRSDRAVDRAGDRATDRAGARLAGHRRAWAAALGVLMVLVLPGTSMSPPDAVTVADRGLASGGSSLRAMEQFPAPSRLPLPPTPTAGPGVTVAAASPTAGATAKATRRAAPKATTKAAPKAAPKTPRVTPTESRRRAPAGPTLISNDRSGLPWASGVYIPGSSPANAKAFGTWRGAAVDVVVDWPARSSWDDVIDPDWLYEAWSGTPYTKVFGVAPVPEDDDSATMARCADGAYNDRWRTFGQKIKASGLDDETVIRLGWEFNGDWYKWSARNPREYAECWRQIVGTVRQVAPKLLWDWTVNRGRNSGLADAREAYPGDAYVDIVGIDSYDMWPGVRSEADWKAHHSGAFGLKFWAAFAADHGKKLSVPEWGVYPGSAHAGHNGGDNALYISKMRAFFAAQGSRLAYEAYFNESDGYYAGSLYGPNQNPAASARYRDLFGR